MQTKGHWGQTNPTTQHDLTVGMDLSPQKRQQDINLSLINQMSVASSLETPLPVPACVRVCVCNSNRTGSKTGYTHSGVCTMVTYSLISPYSRQTGQKWVTYDL